MGTTYMLKYIGKPVISQQQIETKLAQINAIFSTWDSNSELSLLNQKPINQWITVSSELFFVLSESKKLRQQTNGYFDPGIGQLIDVWGFGAIKVVKKPNRVQISRLLQKTSIVHLQLKDGKVKKTKDIHINLSAIAKGYAVDEISQLLSRHNSQNFLVEIGGEVRTRGKNIDNNWSLGIERLNNAQPIAIKLQDQAIATSGNYRNYFVWQGKKYQHILNPSTGLPAKTDLSSVSVVHQSTMMADAYATAMMAMGSVKATILAKQLNLSVVLILDKQTDFNVVKIGF